MRLLLLPLLLHFVTTVSGHTRNNCDASQKDCGYFGCFPDTTSCPVDCDQNLTADVCNVVKKATGAQACVFNPIYSGGKGMCQRNVECTSIRDGECSESCFQCGYFGCLPSGTNTLCPTSCEALSGMNDCETLGGVAGGMACQWEEKGATCSPVRIGLLKRTLPVLPRPTTPTGGATPAPTNSVPPSTDPSSPPASNDWKSVQGKPGLLALYIGLAVGVLALFCVVALLLYRRSKGRRKNKILAAEFGSLSNKSSSSSLASTASETPSPQTQYHRESLIYHVRDAVNNSLGETPSEMKGYNRK